MCSRVPPSVLLAVELEEPGRSVVVVLVDCASANGRLGPIEVAQPGA